ncbi:MAG: acetyl-CoA carboxylase carboxyltransferase subunit alpha [Planctomycetes bacterium]|nr:acetyl-CoA carboxylase carboxyltransferase subunit alpha [Planctomycetota bacterium]
MAKVCLEFEKPFAKLEAQIRDMEDDQRRRHVDLSAEIRDIRRNLVAMIRKKYASLTPWEIVQVARHPDRPQTADYIDAFVKDFKELHGDRAFRDDRAIMCGFGRIAGEKVMIVGHQKGRDTREKVACFFGCAHPEGYRKALRAMRLAEKFGLPVVALIDTQGAYPGIGAEERGIADSIAVNMREMSLLGVPIVGAVIGEGASGGYLGIGVADCLLMLEFAYCSVITPEGCAAILWRTADKAPDAAKALRLTAPDLKGFGVVDDIVPEPLGAAHRNPREMATTLERRIGRHLRELKQVPTDELLERRYAKLRGVGVTVEAAAGEPAPNP